jgi:hypothetical protein
MGMPELKVVDVYSVNGRSGHGIIQGIMVVIEPTPEMEDEDMSGVGVNFELPNGQILEAQIDRAFGFENGLHCYFPRLNKSFKPIGFSEPDEAEGFSFDTIVS